MEQRSEMTRWVDEDGPTLVCEGRGRRGSKADGWPTHAWTLFNRVLSTLRALKWLVDMIDD